MVAARMQPGPVRYARNGDVTIAYQVTGDGPLDLVFVPGFISHLELMWEEPAARRFFTRLASFARLIMYDKREQGMSDRLGRAPTMDESSADLLAVLEAAGSGRAALFGISEGGPLTIAFAAEHPDRVSALVLYGTFPRLTSPRHPRAQVQRTQEAMLADWGGPGTLELFAPTLQDDPRFAAWWARLLRSGGSPRAARALFQQHLDTDVCGLLGRVEAPTLVLHRAEDAVIPARAGKALAAGIPGARHEQLPGADHLWMAGHLDDVLGPVEEHLTGRRSEHEPERILQAILFTDVVDSTQTAAALGDRRWRDLLAALEQRARQEVLRFGGRPVKWLGDGAMATFAAPARAIRAAAAIAAGAHREGLEVRAGVHAGECELRPDGDLAGLAVHIGARVAAAAGPGEVLVSGTVRDLVVGSGLRFAERGSHTLKGVPGTWPLFAVLAPT